MKNIPSGLEVEADYDTWRKYAVTKGLHGSILTYLDIKKNDFYVIENTVDGKSYVTARGWEDLSETIYLYERIAREFASYYDLYQKYKKDYRVAQILAGDADAEVRKRAKNAAFDERISLLGLLLDALQDKIRKNVELEDALRSLLPVLKEVKAELAGFAGDSSEIPVLLETRADQMQEKMQQEDKANALSTAAHHGYQLVIRTLQKDAKELRMQGITDAQAAFLFIKEAFDDQVAEMKAGSDEISRELENLFAFVEKIFGTGNEMLILVTDLTVNANSMKFISRKGCKEYFKYNKKYQLYERQQEISDALEQLQI